MAWLLAAPLRLVVAKIGARAIPVSLLVSLLVLAGAFLAGTGGGVRAGCAAGLTGLHTHCSGSR